MSIYCLIPAKPHAEAKSRLASILSPEQRISLNHWLLRRTLRLARQVVGHVIVVSRDAAIIAQAESQGAWGLPETSIGLNTALTQATRFAMDLGATGILVLPTDLPRVTASDLETILSLGNVEGAGWKSNPPRAGSKPAPHAAGWEPALQPAGSEPALRVTPSLVIAPCRHATGTNALLMRPPGLIPFTFGPGSFAAHCAAARAVSVEPVIYRAETIAFDIDTPDDWQSGVWSWGSEESGNRGIGESGTQGAGQPGIGD